MNRSAAASSCLLLLTCLTISLTGCSSTGAKVTRAPGFGIEMLQREGLLCAGVTALGGGEYAPGDTMSSRFETALEEQRPEVRFEGLDGFRAALGEC